MRIGELLDVDGGVFRATTGRAAWALVALAGALVAFAAASSGCGKPVPSLKDGGVEIVVEPADESLVKPDLDALVAVLRQRLDPRGDTGIVVSKFDQRQLKVAVPGEDIGVVERVRRQLRQLGGLELRIVANERQHAAALVLARKQAADDEPAVKMSTTVRDDDGKEVARWVGVAADEVPPGGAKSVRRYKAQFGWKGSGELLRDGRTGAIVDLTKGGDEEQSLPDEAAFGRAIAELNVESLEVLVIVNSQNDLTERDLKAIAKRKEEYGPVIDFAMAGEASAKRLASLTSENMPDGPNASRLGIIFGREVWSAPSIRGVITDRGQISGRFTDAEVDELVALLKGGRLPFELREVSITSFAPKK